MSHEVIISYSEKDINFAEAVVTGLEEKGIRCWIAPRDIPEGSSFVDAFIAAIQSSEVMVVIFSGNSNDRQAVREVEFAVSNDLTLIPFQIEDFSPSGAMAYLLKTEHWVAATSRPLEDHLDKLIDVITGQFDIEIRSSISPARNESIEAENLLRENGSVMIDQAGREHASKERSPFSYAVNSTEGEFRVVDSIAVQSASSQGLIQFCIGDLTNTGASDSVDVLVVWTVRDSYFPIPGSLIGALHKKGISIEALAEDKEIDLRQAFSCWLSRQIQDPPQGIQFQRILCYEPDESGTAAENVGDIFRSLAPFLGSSFSVRTIATPLLASGSQRAAAMEMLQQLVDSTVHWMSSGLPLDCLKIVCLPDDNTNDLIHLFSELKSKYSDLSLQRGDKFSYDLFISYSHKDVREVQLFEQALFTHQKNLRIFIDRKNLNSGAAWQREIFEAIDDSRKVAVFYSPTYLDSKVCIEEFNIALCRHRESDESILLPIYLYSANLPTYMRLVQFIDCREFNLNRLNEAALELIGNINS